MMTLVLFTVFMLVVFIKMSIFAFRMAWGIGKVFMGIIFLPIVLIALMIAGLVQIAFPLLVVIGVIVLISSRTDHS